MIINLLTDREVALMLSHRLKKERIAQQLKQAELAERAKLSVSTIKNFENHGKITLINLISILKGLGKRSLFDDLFDFETERMEFDMFEYSENLKKIYNKKRVRR